MAGRPQVVADPVKKMIIFPREQWHDLWCLCRLRRGNGQTVSCGSMVREALDIYLRLNHKEVGMAKADYNLDYNLDDGDDGNEE